MDWKVANMMPIFKKGDLSQLGKYRLISLIFAVYKVLESVIRDSIIRHMSLNALLAKEQHSFLSIGDHVSLVILVKSFAARSLSGSGVL